MAITEVEAAEALITIDQYKEQYGTVEWAKIPKGGSIDSLIPRLNDGAILFMYEAYPINGTLIRKSGGIEEFLIERGKMPCVELPDGEKKYTPPQIRGCLNIVDPSDGVAKILDAPRSAIEQAVALGNSIFDHVVRWTKKSVGRKDHEVEWIVELGDEAEWTDELRNLEFYDLSEVCKPHDLIYVMQRLGIKK